MSVENLKEFLNEYSRKDLLDNQKIGLLIENGEDKNGNIVWKINPKKRPNVDLLTMSDREKKEFNNLFPGVAVNPLYAKPIFWFLPFYKTDITKEKADQDDYYIEVSDLSHYTTYLFTRSLVLMLTWFFGINATLLALRSRNKESGEYDFPTNKYCRPYTRFDCSNREKAEEKAEEKERKEEHGGDHYHDKDGNMKGGGKDKLENLFKLLESNIDKTTTQKGGGTTEAVQNDLGKFFLWSDTTPPNEDIQTTNHAKKVGLVQQDKPGGVNQLHKKPGLGMTLDYNADGERYRYTQSKLNEQSGKEEWEQGDFAWFSKGPSFDSTWWWGLQRGPRFQQFYSYVMRNSTRSINKIFGTIFKKMGGFIGGGNNYDNKSLTIFVCFHIFAILTFFMNQSIILLVPFIIVLVWIFKYTFMSKYSGTSAMTLVFDGVFNLGSILLKNAPFAGLFGLGVVLFLIPGIPFLVALFTIPFIIGFLTWWRVLFGYIIGKYGWAWQREIFTKNILYLLFEITLINSTAIEKYYPYDPNSPFLSSFMKEGLGKAAPLGVLIGIFYSEYFKKKNPLWKPFLICLFSVILTTIICKIN